MRMEMIRPEERYPLSDSRQIITDEKKSMSERTPESVGIEETTQPEITDEQLDEIIAKINKAADIFELNIQYKVKLHEATNTQIVQIVRNDEIIAEMPPSKLLDALAKIEENLLGVIVDKRI